MNRLYRLSYKYGRYAIKNLMLIISVGMAAVYVVNLLFPALRLSALLSLFWPSVLHGQIWRLVTFIFIPPSSGLFFAAIAIYFYYSIGGALENQWGSFIFNVYYLIGIIGAVLASVITGYGTNTFINLSLFFAFAILYPDFQVLLFFIIPIKMKYLAILDAVLYGYMFITGSLSTKVSILLSLANLFIFFGRDLVKRIKAEISYSKTRRAFRNQNDSTRRH